MAQRQLGLGCITDYKQWIAGEADVVTAIGTTDVVVIVVNVLCVLWTT